MDLLRDAQLEVSFYDQVSGGPTATDVDFGHSPARLILPPSERFSPTPLRRSGSSNSMTSTASSSRSTVADGSSSDWSSDEAVFLGPQTDRERSYVARLNRPLSKAGSASSRRTPAIANKRKGEWQTPGGSRVGAHPLKKRDSCEFHRRRTLVFSKREVNVVEADGSTSKRRLSGWQGGFYEKGTESPLRANAVPPSTSRDDAHWRRDSGSASSSRNRQARDDPFIVDQLSQAPLLPSWHLDEIPQQSEVEGPAVDQLLDQDTKTADDLDPATLNLAISPISSSAGTIQAEDQRIDSAVEVAPTPENAANLTDSPASASERLEESPRQTRADDTDLASSIPLRSFTSASPVSARVHEAEPKEEKGETPSPCTARAEIAQPSSSEDPLPHSSPTQGQTTLPSNGELQSQGEEPTSRQMTPAAADASPTLPTLTETESTREGSRSPMEVPAFPPSKATIPVDAGPTSPVVSSQSPFTPDLLPIGTPSALRPTVAATPLALGDAPEAPADLSFDPDSPLPVQRGRRTSLRLASNPARTPFDENSPSTNAFSGLIASPVAKVITISPEEIAAPATPVLNRSPLKATTPGRLNALGESTTANMITPQRLMTPRLPPAPSSALRSPLGLKTWDPTASVKKSRAMEEKATARQAAISNQLSAIAASTLSVSRMGFLPAATPRRTPLKLASQQPSTAPLSRPANKVLGASNAPSRLAVKLEPENKVQSSSLIATAEPRTPSAAVVPNLLPASEPAHHSATKPPALSASTSSISSGPAPRLNVREFLAAKKSGIPHVRRVPSASSTSSATSATSMQRAPSSLASPARRLAPNPIGARQFISRTTSAQRPTTPTRPISRLRQALKASQQAQPRIAGRPFEVARPIKPSSEPKQAIAEREDAQVAAINTASDLRDDPTAVSPAPAPASPPRPSISVERPRRVQTAVRSAQPQVRQYVPKAAAAALAARATGSQSSKPARQLTETELKNLTSFHTARNEVYFCSIARNVHKREGPRPPSPNKVRTIAEREEEERKLSRERRARKRESRKSNGDTDGEWDSAGSDAEVMVHTKHIRGPGDDEDYATPARPGKGRKSQKPSDAARVRWDKGLVVRSDGPRAGKLPAERRPLKSCLRHQVRLGRADL